MSVDEAIQFLTDAGWRPGMSTALREDREPMKEALNALRDAGVDPSKAVVAKPPPAPATPTKAKRS